MNQGGLEAVQPRAGAGRDVRGRGASASVESRMAEHGPGEQRQLRSQGFWRSPTGTTSEGPTDGPWGISPDFCISRSESCSEEAKGASLQSWQMLVQDKFWINIHSEDFHLQGLPYSW